MEPLYIGKSTFSCYGLHGHVGLSEQSACVLQASLCYLGVDCASASSLEAYLECPTRYCASFDDTFNGDCPGEVCPDKLYGLCHHRILFEDDRGALPFDYILRWHEKCLLVGSRVIICRPLRSRFENSGNQ